MKNDELAQHLESLQREECYRVDAVLKQSPVETTQRVFFTGSNGAESGPFIRKFIKQDAGLGSAYKRMFEAQQNGHRFKHIPDILECYTRDGCMVVVMECVSGQTLQEAVYENDPSIELAHNVIPQLCDAATELHTEFDPPIIHRDLKPSNVILTGQGLCLIDFGISREYHEGADADTTHFGTREFAPPEQYGFGQTDARSDVYSLGMVIYFCMTEEIPDAQARKRDFAHPSIPEPIRQVIRRAAALDPAERFASASDLKHAFLAATAHRPNPQDEQQHAGGRGARITRKAASIAASAVACLAVIASIVSGIGGRVSQGEPVDTPAADSSAASQDASSSDGAEPSKPLETELTADISGSAAPKNGFDPATNFTVSVCGMEFQVPSCFRTRMTTSDDGKIHYYYAETGSSVAMIMTSENDLDSAPGDENFEEFKDSYVQGFMDSSEMFEEITASTDYELAGHTARIITVKGAAEGIPFTEKTAFFFAPDAPWVGSISFGQTNNTQFDYSADFAKVVTSATPSTPSTQAKL